MYMYTLVHVYPCNRPFHASRHYPGQPYDPSCSLELITCAHVTHQRYAELPLPGHVQVHICIYTSTTMANRHVHAAHNLYFYLLTRRLFNSWLFRRAYIHSRRKFCVCVSVCVCPCVCVCVCVCVLGRGVSPCMII